MNDNIKNVLDKLAPIFSSADEALSSWSGTGNLQFPVLLGMIAVRLNWDEKQVRENDPLVRYYVRNHPDWSVTRGAKGGIMRSSAKQKRDAEKAAKDAAKAQMKAVIETASDSDEEASEVLAGQSLLS